MKKKFNFFNVLESVFLFILVLVMVVVFTSSANWGQERHYQGQFGAIYGLVMLADGSAVPGVVVTLASEFDTEKSTVTSEEGNFRFLHLYPGTYRICFELEGFNTLYFEGIIVKPGERKNISAQIETSSIREEIVVNFSNSSHSSKFINFKPSPRFDDEPNTEEYSRIYENKFLKTKDNPLSTFSIDVDTASYANVRRFIKDNFLPPQDAVRIEEMINYFTYDYPEPKGEHPFAIYTEISTCPWNLEHRLIHIGLQGKKIKTQNLPPGNLVFLMDVSGSMDMPGKLPLLKKAFKLLANNLRENDRVAIVVYAGAAGLVLPSTPGNKKEEILAAIDRLSAGGSTAGGAGIQLAYQIALDNFLNKGNNRVILASDGDFNVGVSSTSELVRLVEEKREKGIYLTVLGFGMGNLKDSRMEQIADKGNGNYYYIDDLLEAQKVLIEEMGATLFTIAKDVKIQVEFNPAKVKAYKLVGYENRLLAKEDFKDDAVDAGELGAGHSVTALYEVVLAKSKKKQEIDSSLKYQESKIKQAALQGNEMFTVKIRYKPPKESKSQLIELAVNDQDLELAKTSRNFRFSAAVAQFGLLLRESKYKGKASYDNVLKLAQGAKGEDFHGYRAEFIRLVKLCKLIK